MSTRILRGKWILYRHINNFSLLCNTALALKSFSRTIITNEEKTKLNLFLKENGFYNERNKNLVLDAINHKINQLSYYMFGYQAKINGINRFMFSPLANLFFKYFNDKEKCSKIFLTMLWAIQYPHPHGGTDKIFNLYPFRLIFKLLCDERLNYKLYAFEVAFLVVFVEKVDLNIYEKLVTDILNLRSKNNEELTKLFKQDLHAYVNSAYEWDYYVSRLFASAGVLDKTKGEVICKLQHGKTNTFRKITRNFVTIPENLFNFVLELEKANSFLQTPLNLNDTQRLKIDIVKEIYSYCPQVLLNSLNEKSEATKYLELPKLIEQYSNNIDNKTTDLFENVLVDGFNMFYNIEAKKISGAGQTDIECLYITKKKKFAVEAKSTNNKLLAINTSRLKEHREKIGGQYTIIITSRYVPAAKRDIQDTKNVIILANTFAEYLYNCINNDIRKIDYENFDDIIEANLGADISPQISNLSILTFGASK